MVTDDTLRSLARVKALALQEMIAAGGKPCWVRTADHVPPPPAPAPPAAAGRSSKRVRLRCHSPKAAGPVQVEKREVSGVASTARNALDAKLRLPIWQTSLGTSVSAREAALLAQMPPLLRAAVERVAAKLDAPRESSSSLFCPEQKVFAIGSTLKKKKVQFRR